MNTFFVGNHPVGHYIARFSSPQASSSPPMYIPGRSPPPGSKSPAESTQATTDLPNASESKPLDQNLPAAQPLIDGEKTFFMKARIMAGQADVSFSQTPSATTSEIDPSNPAPLPAGDEMSSAPDKKGTLAEFGLEEIEDFKWLSKEEVESTVHPDYWRRIKNMLVAQ